jgi:hypothetical protein
MALAQEGALTRLEVLQLARNSFTTSFLPASSVDLYLAELDAKAEGGSRMTDDGS